MSKLRITLIIQLALFAVWGGYLLVMNNTAAPDEIYLETEPVDPRDLLSGAFVALNYVIGAPDAGGCRSLAGSGGNRRVYVRLEKSDRTAAAGGRALPIFEATDCALQPVKNGGLWARGDLLAGNWRGPRIYYGIEKFFVNENDPLKDARSGSVVAKVALDRMNNLRITGLVKKD